MSLADELAKLEELHRSGALSQAEFAQAKAKLIEAEAAPADPPLGQHLAEQLAEVKYQNELARLDREWQFEQQRYLITSNYGQRVIPTPGMGIAAMVIGGGFGLLWTCFATVLMGNFPGEGALGLVRVIFPLFGVLITVGTVALGLNAYRKAQRYREAFEAYQARRRHVRPEEFR